MKKHFILKFVLVCISLCISLNARTQTTAYQTYLEAGVFSATQAPTGEVRFPAEFEPVQSVMVVYPLELPWKLLQEISEDCKLITVINRRKASSITIDEIKTEYNTNGVTISNCEFIIANNDNLEDGINSHWIRDFGPWCIFHGKNVAIVDNIYNRSFVDDKSDPISSPSWTNGRWRDDKFAKTYATDNGITLYGMEVVHTGGNMMQDGRGVGVSDLIVHTQSETFVGLSNETVNQRMNDYLGIDTYHVTIDPQGDYIAHVDCWGKFLAPDKIIIARVPKDHEQYSAYEEVASYFASTTCCWGYPYKVYRVDIPVTEKSEIADDDKIAPYTNCLILNNKVLVPISSLTANSYNDAALDVYREAMPGYEIIGIDYIKSDAYGQYSGWKNTDALHCRTRDIMDFNMLFVDHRKVLFGEQTYQESYPITAKFIAYSGDNITSTQLHYSINDGAYQTVEMTATGNADEYAANITGHNNGDVIKYYVTGEDASGKTCVQPQFGELEPHTFTAGEASGQPAQPVLDITKYYRIKTASGTGYQYLTIFDHTSNPLGDYGGVGVAMLDEDNAGQMFKLEDAGEGKYYLKSADGYYIYCQPCNVDAIDGTQKSALWGFDSENEFELQCDKGYFKVENVNGNNYVFCNVSKETRATIATWGLEEVPLSITISANNNTVTVNESVQLNATAIGGTGNYTYSWSPADGLSSTTIANPTFTSATANTYTFTCTVTDNEETATSNTITITVNETQQSGTGSEIVTIGDENTSNKHKFLPIRTWNNYSISQQYYLKDEINKNEGGSISSIAFHTADGDFPCARTLTIYMRNTDVSSFETRVMELMDASEIVFDGEVYFEANKWVTINLTKDFNYDGKHILLCVYDHTNDYTDNETYFKIHSASGDRANYKGGEFSSYPADISGTLTSSIPIIQFTFGAAQVDPITISANPSKVVVGDKINFTVMQGSTNVTTSAKFYIGDNEISNPYTTTSAGTFTVRAEKDGQTAETTFTVVEPLVLAANNTTFTANGTDAVTFTVTQGGNDVNDATIYIDGNAQAGYIFKTTTAGTYTVYAQKGDLTSNEITITAEAPAVIKPVIDLTKYYRIKVNSGEFVNQYLHISNTANTVIASAKADDQAQIFKIEDAGNGNYYLKSANGLYIKCDAAPSAWWNIYGIATNKTPLLFEYTNETEFYIRDYDKITGASVSTNTGSDSAKSYFKVENGTVYCDAPKTLAEVVTWVLEEVPLSVTISADKNTVTVNESVQLNATAIGGTGNYTYSWSPADGLSSTTIANPTFTSATVGTYDIICTATDNGESVTSNTVTITVNEAGTGGGTEEVVTIDGSKTGNDTTAINIPIYAYNKVSISQQYYTQHEIGRNNGTITKIAFKTTNDIPEAYPYERSIEIYMSNTEAADSLFATNATTMIPLSAENKLFTGSVKFTANAWVTIELGTPFTYNGKNILVCVNDITKSYINYKPSFETFKYSTDKGYKAKRVGKDSNTAYNPTTTINVSGGSTNVPCIQFTFAGDTPQQPVKPTITVDKDKQRFWADNSDYVTFTVTPEDAEIWYTAGTDTYQLTDTTFKTSNAGTYSFFAKKDDLTSDTIEVVAVAENELVLTLSKNTIVANGIEDVTFTVTQVDINDVTQDVTNKCTFKINGTAITGNTFFTNRAKDYTVTATKGNKTATAALTATALSGEENVVLIDGNVIQPAVTTSVDNTVPVCNYYEYGISQQYYKASEIGKNENGIISHISFKTAKTAATYTRDIDIYIVNTDESDFGETSRATKPMSDNDLVYSGKVTFTQNSWVTIELTNKFTYTANKNILVSVNDKTGEWEELSSYFDTYEKSDLFRTLYKGNNDGAFDPTDTIKDCGRIKVIPFVKFTFEKEQEVITLKANKTLIKADDVDYVSFGVQKEGLNPENVTEESEIHILREGDQTETVLDNTTGFKFTATVAGNYTAYAKKGEAISNTVNFRAVYPIEITASTDTIVADNVDFVTFTVKQSTGLGSEPIDITNAATIFVDNTPLGVGVNTFKTDIIDTYFVYAEYDGINSNVVTFFAKSHINYDEDIEGSLDGEYFNPKGYVTYNKGEDNEYTLVARKEDGKAIIMEDNVWTFGTGTGTSIELKRPNPHKPQADATLIIPEKILFDDNWVTVTEIEDYAFDTLFEYRNYNDFNPGDPLNKHFTNLIIPSTIEKVGTYTFGFPVETSIICFAPVPPEVTGYPPFLKDTYKNAILYVPAPYVDAYKEAKGWGKPTDEADKDAYFVNILPIETPTFYIAGSWDDVNNWVPDYGYPNPEEDVIILADARIEDSTVANVGRVDIISGSITIADGGQLIHTNPGVSVTLEKEIIGYHGNTSPTSWYTISSPLYPSIESSTVENLLTNDFDLYRYDEPTHYWDNIEDLLDTIDEGPKGNWTKLDAARGYLYANNEDVTLKFKGVANHTGGTYNLTRDVWDGVLIGFHLVGNPFTHDIYMNNAFNTDADLASGYYILSSTGAWSANLGNDKAIEPCQGVLIKAISEGTLTINKKVGPAAQTRNKASDEFLTISVSNKNYEDKAYVLFSTEYPLEKVNHQNKDIPMVYIPMEEDNYAIATMGNDVKEIPVSFEAKTMGQYTISVKAQNYDAKEMYLVDRMTGIETNLLLEDYTFMATTTDNHERFIITMSTDVDTNENFIFINNGEMIINNIEGRGVLQIFDVMGRYISHTEVSGSANISTEEFTSGVYIIRMIDDNGIKTQKVVL